MSKLTELSVFFPAYNEESNIEKTVTQAAEILPSIAKTWEIIIVNDGSRDKTEAVSQSLARKDHRIRVITHSPNRGYGAALKSGFTNAKYEWIAFTDADGQFDFSEITEFVSTQEKTNADLVIGYYRKREVPFYRKLNTAFWQLAVFVLFGLKVRDIDCAFKLISKKVVTTIEPLESERGAFISSELLIKAKKHKFKIVEIPITHYPRIAGKGTGSDLDVIIRSFIDLFTLWIKLR